MSKLHFITIPIDFLEETLKVKVKKNTVALGLDTASKTGYCVATTNKTEVHLNIGFINVNVGGIKDKDERNERRYSIIFETFLDLIKKEYTLVIENVYYGGNAQTLILLSRIGAIAWSIGKIKGCSKIIWKSAVQARKALGFKGNKKKTYIKEQVNTLLNLSIDNDDEIDAIVLALNGVIE